MKMPPWDEAMPWSPAEGGVALSVWLAPGAGRDRLDGVVPDAAGRPCLKLRVAARPVEGAANRALIGFLASALRMRAGDISFLSGETARHKRLLLAGDAAALGGKLAAWISSARA